MSNKVNKSSDACVELKEIYREALNDPLPPRYYSANTSEDLYNAIYKKFADKRDRLVDGSDRYELIAVIKLMNSMRVIPKWITTPAVLYNC